jgi:hypothetical protein
VWYVKYEYDDDDDDDDDKADNTQAFLSSVDFHALINTSTWRNPERVS